MKTEDFIFMKEALRLAKEAYDVGEVPIGAVIVDNGEIIACGKNEMESGADATLHAEMIAIRGASKAKGAWRLDNATLYTTLEPCPMCAGAIKNSRISRVVVGARDLKNGACGSVYSICEAEFGILEEESEALLKEFFKKLRD